MSKASGSHRTEVRRDDERLREEETAAMSACAKRDGGDERLREEETAAMSACAKKRRS